MNKFWKITLILTLLFLVGCSSGPPRKLVKTAENKMLVFMAQNSNITEANMYLKALLIDQKQLSEEKWCLTYEIGDLLWFSTIWEKQERDWVQTEIQPYVDNCNWAR